ncbi:MAG TPA: NIPSNAP family protein [Acidobacteriota bacterium]|jgi:hypothetical protein
MNRKSVFVCTLIVVSFFAGLAVGRVTPARAEGGTRVFELRTYTANEGKLEALQARFRNHTTRLFEKHGMSNIGYWVPKDAPLSQNTLIYLLSYPNREAAQKSWNAFRNDPDWKKVQTESEVNGKLVSKVDSVYLDPTDYSPMR